MGPCLHSPIPGATCVELQPPSLSQATSCDGNLYQITPDGDHTAPLPGVLPIYYLHFSSLQQKTDVESISFWDLFC